MDDFDDLLMHFQMACQVAIVSAVAISAAQVMPTTVKRKHGIHPDFRRRSVHGEFVTMFKVKKQQFPDHFYKYCRMTPANFDKLLSLVNEYLPKQKKKGRKRISNEERLALTIRYLATGLSFAQLSQTWLLGESTCRFIINQVLSAMWLSLQPIYMPTPTKETWLNNAKVFQDRWNLPFCVGALDGKHVIVDAPKNSGSEFFSYKKQFSVVLMAIADGNYKFTAVDIGWYLVL